MADELWVEKYRPKVLDDLVLSEDIKSKFRNYLDRGTIPNILLFGRPGIGKTTLAECIRNELKCESFLYINASDKSGIDFVRNDIKDFAECVGMDNALKLVILDEADGLTNSTGMGPSAQDGLRNLIEKSADDTRFILTCNHLNKISKALQSRCTPLQLRFTLKDATKRIFEILQAEEIDFAGHETEIVKLINRNFPDIRRSIAVLEQCCVTGKFVFVETDDQTGIDNTINFITENITNVMECRNFWIKNETLFDADYEKLGSALFNSLDNPVEMLKIGEKLFQLNMILDKEIGFYMCVLELCSLRGSLNGRNCPG